MKKTILGLALMAITSSAMANDVLVDNLKKASNGRFANSNISVIREVPTPSLKGFYEITLDGQPMIVHKNGVDAIVGDLYNLDTMINTSAAKRTERMASVAKKEIDSLSEDTFVTFAPKSEKIGTMYVFTDSTCGYCKKLHAEIDELQSGGVEVKYIPYPRGGAQEGSAGYEQAKQYMCATDIKQAMTDIKAGTDDGKYVSQSGYDPKCVSTVTRGLAAGAAIGMSGTPFIYLSSGEAIPGYQPAASIITKLKAVNR
jgi:thiol:disulfide interchange protein DsbC